MSFTLDILSICFSAMPMRVYQKNCMRIAPHYVSIITNYDTFCALSATTDLVLQNCSSGFLNLKRHQRRRPLRLRERLRKLCCKHSYFLPQAWSSFLKTVVYDSATFAVNTKFRRTRCFSILIHECHFQAICSSNILAYF